MILVKASLTIKINGVTVLKKDLESVKQKAALLSLGISLCIHHISPGLPSFLATLPCYKLTHHSPFK